MAVCVAVTLGEPMGPTVEGLWADIAARWDVRPLHGSDRPHLTLVTVRDGVPGCLRPRLAAIAAATKPLRVSGAGYGLFVGHGSESPVIHMALTRTPELSALHEAVYDAVTASGGLVDGQTEPGSWRPHVTLADAGLSAVVIGEIMSDLARKGPRHWTADVNNISVIAGDGRTAYQLPLTGRT